MDTSAILHVEGLDYRYPQNQHSLRMAGLDVHRGEVVLVTGPSGCGKSTLARCLTGLIPHLYRGELGGQVLVDGLGTTAAPLWRLTERAGMVFQNPASQMLAATVEGEIVFGLENLGLPRDEVRARLEEGIARFGLQDLRARSPQTLSGGEQQRLALAAITARQPPVLVLDEPLSMLDSTAAQGLVCQLEDFARADTAVVVCEHRVEALGRIPVVRTVNLGDKVEGDGLWRLPQEGTPPSQTQPFVLQVSSLGVRLGGRDILRGLDFPAPGGQVLAIVGRNGVGKTTLLRALAGIQRHTGMVHIDGKRPDLAIVFQNPDLQLFNATVREEILYRVADPDPDWYRWLVHVLGLQKYEDMPPLLLSEGEKKRVALAIALMRQPAHGVLLDEPALGQDEAHKARLIHLARVLANSGRLVVMTTHDLALAAQADRMMLLGERGFVADGPPGEVLRDGTTWAQLGLIVPEWVLEQV